MHFWLDWQVAAPRCANRPGWQRRILAFLFFVVSPPLALVFAMLPRRVRVAPLAAALAPMALFSIYGAGLVFQYCYTGSTKLPVSEYLAKHMTQADAVWRDD